VQRRLQVALREPARHAQFAAADAEGLVGYLLARVLRGEFGRRAPRCASNWSACARTCRDTGSAGCCSMR
jgi:hypothetical protein